MSNANAGKRQSYGLGGFWALIATQFQGAFNDNAYKLIITLFLINTIGVELSKHKIAGYATIIFALPFIIFPVYAGALSDKWSKRKVAIATKYLEVFVMSLGCVAFYFRSTELVWVTLFLMAAQSAFFSPAKYGILPEILAEEKLSWGNGVLQMGTFVAIISGTAIAGPLLDALGKNVYLVSLPLILFSIIGVISSHGISASPAANPTKRIPLNPWGGMGQYFKLFARDRWLFLTMLGIAFFFFAGLLLQLNIIGLAKDTLKISDSRLSILLAVLALGIGGGSLLCGYLSRGKIEVGLIPLGALGLAISNALLALPQNTYETDLVLLFALGIFSGFFIVPLNAVLQQRSPDDAKGGMIATSNFVTFTGILLAGGLYWVFGELKLTPQQIFLITAVLTTLVGIYICWLLPVFLLRFLLWCAANTVYRLRVMGRVNIPERGGALLVANHTSFIDALAIQAAIDRPIRFIMFQDIFESRWVKPLAKLTDAIPISSNAPPRELIESLRAASDAIKAGDLVCLFPEGQITRTGHLLPFKKGFERIMKNVDAPIIPMYLDRLWGSVFSYDKGHFFWKFPHKIPFPITINIGEGMPADTTPFRLRSKIQELGTDAYIDRKQLLLHHSFIRKARKHPFELAIADGLVPGLKYLKTLAGSIVFARKLKKLLGDQSMTGVLIPTSVGAALVNLSLALMGKVSVNLNYTTSKEGRASVASQCDIKHVITSRTFLEKLPIEVPGEAIYLEDIKESVTSIDRMIALFFAMLCPVRLLERILGGSKKRSQDDLVTIIFSSGSEGDPKGVMLSHKNIHSNINGLLQIIPLERTDCVMGMLPFFHSFGYTATLWLPLLINMKAVYHPNPMDTRIIGELIRKYKATVFIATSTFLQPFIRRCTPEQMSSLKYIICGAEKLAPKVREAFAEKFGVEPFEGYGTTECAPVVSANCLDFRSPGFYQKGMKHGTIGHPIPGVSVRTVDPDTGEVFLDGEPGVLEVKGPNIMKGYLNMPEKTASVLKDGWYSTGDMASVDEDGYITLTGRLSRFSKIGGEMIPHTVVEDALQKIVNLTDRAFVVTAVEDARKGERLVVLHTLNDSQLNNLLERLEETKLPNLWLPKNNSFYAIKEIPELGTGKIDLKAIKDMARKASIEE